MKKTLWISLLALFSLVLFTLNVAALGVTPADVKVDYSPGLKEEINFKVRPSSDREIGAKISITDSEISEYITLSKTEMDFTDESEDREFTMTIDIPTNEKGLVGQHAPRIIISGISVATGAMLSATAGVKIPIRVYFPYPGKYVDINRFVVHSVNEGEDAIASWTLQSRGDDIVTVSPEAEFFDSDGNMFFSKELDPMVLMPGQVHTESLTIPTKDKPFGNYFGMLRIEFDGTKKNASDEFVIGTMDAEMTNYGPKELDYNSVNKMDFVFENKWNGEFDDVYGSVKLAGRESKTPTTILEPLRGVSIRHFVDVTGVEPGNYTGTFKLFFGGNEKDFEFNVTVLTEEETQKKNGTYEEPFDYTFIMILIVVILLVTGVIIYLSSVRNKKD